MHSSSSLFLLAAASASLSLTAVEAFQQHPQLHRTQRQHARQQQQQQRQIQPWQQQQQLLHRPPPASATDTVPQSSTSLQAWFFGGDTVSTSVSGTTPEEMVKVRIERTSANSRRIAGEITVDNTPLDDVWAVLTDYDRLSIHVPNLIESRITSRPSTQQQPGDGTFNCRLYQKGAQKIVGFDFSATVTMDMQERVVDPNFKQITFRCVDSPFFSVFDGTWSVKQTIGPDGKTPQTAVSYVVDVRPKGPVPVAALEWRIREDVPTNLRAVKAASLKEGMVGVLAARAGLPPPRQIRVDNPASVTALDAFQRQKRQEQQAELMVANIRRSSDWDYDETMAKYL